jgi:hypothetical protein
MMGIKTVRARELHAKDYASGTTARLAEPQERRAQRSLDRACLHAES